MTLIIDTVTTSALSGGRFKLCLGIGSRVIGFSSEYERSLADVMDVYLESNHHSKSGQESKRTAFQNGFKERPDPSRPTAVSARLARNQGQNRRDKGAKRRA